MRRILTQLALGSVLLLGACDSVTPAPQPPENVDPAPQPEPEPQTPVEETPIQEPPVEEVPVKTNAAPNVDLSVLTMSSLKRGVWATAFATDADGDVLTYVWDFGDGTMQGGGNELEHSYVSSGSYTVTVTVSDGQESVSASKRVDVSHLRPDDAPDVLIIGFAGRCGVAGVGCSNAPVGNTGYLDNSDTGTIQAIAETIGGLGYSVGWLNGRSHLNNKRESDSLAMGFNDVAAFTLFAQETWISDFDNPTRLILVGHSHGTVWASLLAWNFPELTFDYAIYLDGICRLWWDDHEPYFVQAFDNAGYTRPWPLETNRTNGPCQAVNVSGFGRQDIEDVVPDNVIYGLEVQAAWWSAPQDAEPNHRLSGNKYNIKTIRSNNLHSDPSPLNSAVHVRGTGAMDWVEENIGILGLPKTSLSTMSTVNLKERVPAPEGFEYVD